nr:TPA_asm: hypothetical protein HUJ06_015760 [Nelumbo nucifera]
MANRGSEVKWVAFNSREEEEQDEAEALSLSDLPIMEIKREKHSSEEIKALETEEDFEFGSWGASLLTESEMCAADDVFFQGQILPLRLSVSSDSGLTGFRQDSRNFSRCGSRSESLEHSSSCGFTSVSSRSSSCRSHNSSSSSSVNATGYKPRVKNHFHTHPSPKPQLWYSSATARPGNAGNRDRRSTIWGLFRVGVVRTPEIELDDLKRRNRNKSCNSSSSHNTRNGTCGGRSSLDEAKIEKKTTQKQSFLDKSGLSSCKCSVSAVETVSSRVLVTKIKSNKRNSNVSESDLHETSLVKQQQQQQDEGKQAMSHRRTFEWLKELSITDVPRETQ